MSTPLVTVLTAVRNGMPYLPETVASIQAQTFTDWEYIIVDDASDDDTVKWVQSEARRDSRIRLIRRQESAGPFVAANAGLFQGQGDFIVRTDADDLSGPTRIEKQVRLLTADHRLTGCITNKISFSARGVIGGSESCLPIAPEALKWVFAMGTRATHSSLCFRREPIVQAGGYKSLPASADYDLIARLARSDRLVPIPEVLSMVRRHDKRLSRRSGTLQNSLGYKLAREHLLAISGEKWDLHEIEALWAIGASSVYRVSRALNAIARWEQAWRRATPPLHLRDELQSISTQLKQKFLWSNLRSEPLYVVSKMFVSSGVL
jgi:glycosyltransferase involved in cell wall biosynthesis